MQSVAITPDQAPSAAFTATTGLAGQATSLDGSGSSASGGQSVARYDWDFGDGSTAANGGPTPTHIYTSPGNYTVRLTVTDNAGCSTHLVYTGQTASCNGGPSAQVSHQVTISRVKQTLSVATSGTGAGTVTSSDGQINCGATCSHAYDQGTQVTLKAEAKKGSSFTGWTGGGCSGTTVCKVTMSSDRKVMATFDAKPPNTEIATAEINQKKSKATFRFKAKGNGTASGFQCQLKRQGKKPKDFKKCSSPKTYKNLKPSKYTFKVRAKGPGGKDQSPAKREFKIKP